MYIDDREEHKPGFKFNEWELKGVPLRIELGPKDLEKEQVVITRRDTGKKEFVKITDVTKRVEGLLEEIQNDLLNKARKQMNDSLVEVKNYTEFKKAIKEGKFVKAAWCGSVESEEKIKDENTGAKSLNFPYEFKETGKCIITGEMNCKYAIFAKSY